MLAARRSPLAAVAWLGTCAPGASATRPCIPPEHLAPGHDGALLRPPGHHLHHVLGRHRHRRALVRAEGTQPRSDHHHAGCHGCLLLPLLAHRHPGSAEPPVWTAAEERDHLVRALPVGVTSPRCLSSLDDPGSMSLMTPPSLPSPHSCKVLSAGT